MKNPMITEMATDDMHKCQEQGDDHDLSAKKYFNMRNDSMREVHRLADQLAADAVGAVGDQELTRAAKAVITSFHAIGADRNGLVRWTVDPVAMRRLIIAVGKFDWNEPIPAQPATSDRATGGDAG